MSDYFPFWMFCSVVVLCITWHNIRKQDRDALKDPQAKTDDGGSRP